MKFINRKKYIQGQVMLTVVIFFLFLSTTIVLGIAVPIMKQVGIAEDNLKSKASYYSAESALEDVYYRLNNSKTVGATETMDINNAQVTITTSTIFSGKQVIATANTNNIIRKLQSTLVKGEGVVFKYGTQAGQGGIIFKNNSHLVGTLYSDGNIVGDNGANITGDAFVAGATGLIKKMEIGGTAHAHTVTNSTITGNLYCQNGSGNNKSCNTSEADPGLLPLPIADDEINQWESDAAAGGTSVGDMTISSPTTLGPKKIVGNLTIDSTLTLSNTLWVTGNVIINDTVELASSYGASSGVLIADGYIDINNGVVFQDSGTAGSFILLLSNSTCDANISGSPCNGNNAINVGNNSTLTIVNAQKGTVYFQNNAGVKEAVGNLIRLKNNSIITYGSGLININFTSGSAGSYNIIDWGEIQ